VNEIIAAHRTLARRLDAIEVNVVKSVERALADLERRLMTRINEVAASTAAIQTRVETSDTATRVENGELRVSLNELEKKLKDDTAQRAKSVQAVIESSTRPLPAMVESAVKTGEALQAVDSTMRVATTLLKDISQGMQDRNGHVDNTIFGLHERSNVVEARLRELTELYADMMTEAKKSKSWWR
jgi:regulator of replication initiation timing